MTQIDIRLNFATSLVKGDALHLLQSGVGELLPKWSAEMHVWRYREPNFPIKVSKQGSLARAVLEIGTRRGASFRQLIAADSPSSERIFGSVELRGANPAVTVVIAFDTSVMSRAGQIYRWGNSITVQVRRERVEGRNAESWAADAFERFAAALSPVYAHAEATAEFDHKNMLLQDRSAAAVGVDISKSLPGLYWLNFFGRPYCEFIGMEKLMGIRDAFEAKAVGDGILLRTGETAADWDGQERKTRELRILEAIGRHYFFSKDDPDRLTVVPPFLDAAADNRKDSN